MLSSVRKVVLSLTAAALLSLFATTLAAFAAEPELAPGANAPEKTASPSAVDGAPAATSVAPTGNWPCVQAKIDKIDAAAVWDGPPLPDASVDDDDISRLVPTLLNRRYAIADIEKAIKAYSDSVPEASRDEKLTELFSSVLEAANTQRNGIIHGIERYQKRQHENAKEIESQGSKIAELESKAPTDLTQPTPELEAAREKYDWFTRVFQERQANIPIACEIPILIEQRVFAVARAIRAQMKT